MYILNDVNWQISFSNEAAIFYILAHAILEPGITFKKCASTMTMWGSFWTLSQAHCTDRGNIWIGKKDFRLK